MSQKIDLLTANGKTTVSLFSATLLGSGTAGDVYSLIDRGFPGLCVKIYKNLDKDLPQKLEAMIRRPPKDISIQSNGRTFVQFAWPLHLVKNSKGDICGFAMPELDFKLTKSMVTYIEPRESRINLTAEQRSLPQRIAVAAKLCALMANLHQQGHAFVDFKDQNVRIYPDNGLVGFVDTDGFRIQAPGGLVFPGLYTTGTFNSPESVRGKKDSLAEEHDRFVLAILLFRLLNGGIHPFQGVPRQQQHSQASFTIDQHIEHQFYPYGAYGSNELSPTLGSKHEFWDSKTLAMFERTFNSRKPGDRVTAVDWARHFSSLRKNKKFDRCPAHPHDFDHVHFAGNRCPICTFAGRPTSPIGASTSTKPASSWSGVPALAPPSTPPPFAAPNNTGTQQLATQAISQTANHRTPHIPAQRGGQPQAEPSRGCLGIMVALGFIAFAIITFTNIFKDEPLNDSSDVTENTATSTASAPLTTKRPTPMVDESALALSSMAVAAVNVNVRSTPSPESEIIAILKRGTVVQAALDQKKDDFVPVKLDHGGSGWIGQKMLITAADAQRLEAISAADYFKANENRASSVLAWANTGGTERPQVEIDQPGSIWFTQSALAAKNNGDLSASQDAYLAAICADAFAYDTYIALGYVAFEHGSDNLLKQVATISVQLNNSDADTYVLKGLDAIRNSSSEESKIQESTTFFETAISFSENVNTTHKYLRKLASEHSDTGMPEIIEAAIANTTKNR
jgi:hypothetical protein